ncbi:hypothetical protein ANANG_G00206410 [Anguilla anguilla]|uniref:Uncharacterized protein n=1 Tax=Anguilla anguilla TaxID=7936 RepID=A0A9D3M2H8_ANGAN|nr:hypothetical protein ANANG_G00206410 [Anguilla anguilla]
MDHLIFLQKLFEAGNRLQSQAPGLHQTTVRAIILKRTTLETVGNLPKSAIKCQCLPEFLQGCSDNSSRKSQKIPLNNIQRTAGLSSLR